MLDVYIETWGNADIIYDAADVTWGNAIIQVAIHRGGSSSTSDKNGTQIWYEKINEEIQNRRIILHLVHNNELINETKYRNRMLMHMFITDTKLIMCNESKVKLTFGRIYKT